MSDGAALWEPDVDKLTALAVRCQVKVMVLNENRSDDTIINDDECDRTVIKGKLKGYTGEWIRSFWESPAFDLLVNATNLYVDPITKRPLFSIPTEDNNSCACGAGCGRGGWAQIVWRQMQEVCDASGSVLHQQLGPNGLPMWEVQVYPHLEAKGFSVRKVGEAKRTEGDRTFTVTADANWNFPVGDLVVPDQISPGNYVSLVPAAAQNVTGGEIVTPQMVTDATGSRITIYTEAAPPTIECRENCVRWESLDEAAMGKAVAAAVKAEAKAGAATPPAA